MNINTIKETLSVFPLKKNSKLPAVKWQDYNQPLLNNEDNYGINCEKSNIVVIDMDVKDNKNGYESWIDLCNKYNVEPPDDTLIVTTPNDGYHVYFKTDKTFKSSVSKLGLGIDIRAKGGYVVGPGSKILKADGSIGTYEIINESSISMIPDWLDKELILINKDIKQINSDDLELENTDSFPDEYARKALNNAYETVCNSMIGSRNDTLNRETFGAAKAGAPKNAILDTMIKAGLEIGLSYAEVSQTVENAINAGSLEYVPRLSKKDMKDLTITTKEYWTNIAVGDDFIKLHNGNIRKVIGNGKKWLKYNDREGIWQDYDYEEVLFEITKFVKEKFESLRKSPDVDKDVKLRAMNCTSNSFCNGVFSYVSINSLIHERELNRDKDRIVVKNGVVHLKTGQLEPFSRDAYYIDKINVEYNKNFQNDLFLKILNCVDKKDRDYLQLIAGQSLTGHQTATEKCFFLLGGGQNGKSSLVNLLTKTSGSYGGNPPQNVLLREAKGRNSNDLYAFKGLRQAIIEELPDAKYLDIGAIKRLVGTEHLTARPLYKDNETFEITSTLWITCNSLPGVSETDHGTWRRLIIIPFPYTYTTDQSKITPHNKYLEADSRIKIAIQNDEDVAKACLAWRINGAVKWYNNPELEDKLSENMVSIKENWKISGDSISQWIHETFESNKNSYCLTQDLLDSYNKWLLDNGHAKVSAKTLIKKMTEHEIYYDWELNYRMRGTIMKKLHHSIYYNGIDNPRLPGEKASHIIGLAFKK